MRANSIYVQYVPSLRLNAAQYRWKLSMFSSTIRIGCILLVQVAEQQPRYTILDLFKPSLMRVISLNTCYLWFVASMIFYGLTLNVDTLVGELKFFFNLENIVVKSKANRYPVINAPKLTSRSVTPRRINHCKFLRAMVFN